MDFKLPKECYEKITVKNSKGYKTYYRFNYSGEIFSRVNALELAYRDYMRNHCSGMDFYDSVGQIFYKQHKLMEV